MPENSIVYAVAVVSAVVLFGIGYLLGYINGSTDGNSEGYDKGRKSRDHEWQQGREQLMLSATKAGVASYVLNETTGKVEFQWKEVKKNA